MRTMQLEPPPTDDELFDISERYYEHLEAVVEKITGALEKAWSELSPEARLSGLRLCLPVRPTVPNPLRPPTELVVNILVRMLPDGFVLEHVGTGPDEEWLMSLTHKEAYPPGGTERWPTTIPRELTAF